MIYPACLVTRLALKCNSIYTPSRKAISNYSRSYSIIRNDYDYSRWAPVTWKLLSQFWPSDRFIQNQTPILTFYFFSGNFEFRATHHDLDVDMPHFHIWVGYKIAILATIWGFLIKPQYRRCVALLSEEKKFIFLTIFCSDFQINFNDFYIIF